MSLLIVDQDFHSDKANYLDDILKQYECTAEETAYVGDDLFDLGIMQKVKYAYCPFRCS